MLRMLLEERLEDGRGFQLLGIFLVARERGLIHRERVEDARFHVAGILPDEPFHALLVGERCARVASRHRRSVNSSAAAAMYARSRGVGVPVVPAPSEWRRARARSAAAIGAPRTDCPID